MIIKYNFLVLFYGGKGRSAWGPGKSHCSPGGGRTGEVSRSQVSKELTGTVKSLGFSQNQGVATKRFVTGELW